ncbi:alanine--tRNA ligase [Patescibacteria group bacterium]|nr:alanine--tRNA ligase [Patescibacteria group bacterium]
MKAKEIRQKYIDFFVKNDHKQIPGASLIPENDPTVLFTTAGMHPLVPYLLGQEHPAGRRLVDCQKCLRTDDIDEVGDLTHLTFFEMMGNWSLGDYFKEEAIKLSYEFLTGETESGGLGIEKEKLCVSCFAGDEDAGRDEEAAKTWEELGFERWDGQGSDHSMKIFFFGKKENWWGPAGLTGPCGPDTEMFVINDKVAECEKCASLGPACECGRYVEIWNDVFMEYNKGADGLYSSLKQKNVDTGFGLERVTAMLQGKDSVFETELFEGIIGKIHENITDREDIDDETETQSIRIVADHLRAATFLMADKITPSNTDQGYILRRLIRRAIRHGFKLWANEGFCSDVAAQVIADYSDVYPELEQNRELILGEMSKEEEKFKKALVAGEREFEKLLPNLQKGNQNILSGRLAFRLYDTYGYPLEMTKELAAENGLEVDTEGFNAAYEKHQELSRQGAENKFKGGLADDSEKTTALHTATHLLHQALRNVLGDHVEQRGSNITADRLRFDFCHPDKMTPEQIKQVEDMVNEQIAKDMPVIVSEMTVEEAKAAGAIGLFESKYGDNVKVYAIGDFSKEICGGPHVEKTGMLGRFTIKKEQSSSSGVRRVKAVLG